MVESYIEFYAVNFFHIVATNQWWNMNITGEINFVRSILIAMHKPRTPAEAKERDVWQKQVKQIWEQTAREINTQVTIVEVAYNRNVMKGFNKMVEIQNNDSDWIEYSTAHLYDYLKKAEAELVSIVVIIASYYKIQIPVGQRNTAAVPFMGNQGPR